MSAIKRIWREYIRDEIKEKNDKYFVTYHPINLKNDKFATLHIIFTKPIEINEIAEVMEEELDIWLLRYSLPIMVISFDEKEDKFHLGTIRGQMNLLVTLMKKLEK